MPVTERYVESLYGDRKLYTRVFHDKVRTNREMRFMEHKIDVPENYAAITQETRVPIIPDMLTRVLAITGMDFPVLKVPPAGPGREPQEDSSRKERWSYGALARMELEQNRPIYRMGLDAALTDGMGVWKVLPRKDVWDARPERKKKLDPNNPDIFNYTESTDQYMDRINSWKRYQKFPITWTDVDTLTYFPSNENGNPTEVLEVTKRPLIPTLREFGIVIKGYNNRRKTHKWDFDQGVKFGDPLPIDVGGIPNFVEMWEYWNEYEFAYFIDGILVHKGEHNHGRTPYFHFAGQSSHLREMHRAFISVIDPFKDLIKTLDKLLTMKTSWAYLAAWPFLKETGQDAGPGTIADPSLPPIPNDFAELEIGSVLKNVEFMAPPPTGKDLNDMVELCRVLIDRSGLPSVLYGSGVNTSSGYQTASLMQAGQVPYRLPLENAGMALKQIVPHCWYLVKHDIQETVHVWSPTMIDSASEKHIEGWADLGPDMDDNFVCEVDIKPLLPVDDIAVGEHGIHLSESGLASRRWVREEKLKMHDPEAMEDEVWLEDVLRSPVVNMPIIQNAMMAGGIQQPQQGVPGAVEGGEKGGAGGVQPPGPFAPSMPGQNMPAVGMERGSGVKLPNQGGRSPGVVREPGGPRMRQDV